MAEEEKWGANPINEGEIPEEAKVGAEQVRFMMPIGENAEMLEVNLLQVVNQLFMDMGELHARLQALEGAEKPRIILPSNGGIEV